MRKNHPVWTVYDKLRTARLNVKYYSHRLQFYERMVLGMDLILGFTAPSSAIAGLAFWDTESGSLIWKVLGIIAAIVAMIKPISGFSKKIKDLEIVLSGYRTLEYDLMEIKSLIEQNQKYDSNLQADLKKAIQREKVLVSSTPETRPTQRIADKCEEEVRNELPDSIFYIPEEN